MTEEENRLGDTARYDYDGVGNLVREERFSGEVIRYDYDRMNRLVVRSLPEGDERYDYDRAGRITAAENAAAELTFQWDAAGRLTESYNATVDRGLHYEYDRAGNRTALIFDGGRRVGYEYGVRNEVTALTDPDGRTTTFDYDEVGREVERVLPNGITTAWTYDRAGRVTTIATGGREGHLAGRGYAYDPAGRITARVDETGAIRAYRYDAAGRLATVAYPYGSEKMRNDLIERIRLGLLEADTAYDGEEEDEAGSPWNQPGPPPWANNDGDDNDTEENAGTDDLILDWLEPYLTAPPEMMEGTRPLGQNGTVFTERLRLERGEAGVLAERLREIGIDGAHLARDQWVWQEQFSYDTRGNRTEVATGWGAIDYTYNRENRLLAAGERRYDYDGDGNLITERLEGREVRYRYNGRDLLIEASGDLLSWTEEGPPASEITYTYDALGRRTSREARYRAGGAVGYDAVAYLSEGLSVNVAEELRDIMIPPGVMAGPHTGGPGNNGRATGRPEVFPGPEWLTPPPWQTSEPQEITETNIRQYIHANGRLFSHTDLVDRPVSRSHTSWYHQDMRGSTMMLTGRNGEAVASYSYDAFGVVFDDHPAVGRPQPTVPEGARAAVERGTEYLYTGKRLDPDTGHIDYGFRDYAPRLARFTTVDPIKDGNHWYAYVNNDPVNFVDPLGLAATDSAATGLNDIEIGKRLLNIGKSIFQVVGGAILTQLDSPVIGLLDVAGGLAVADGISDIILNYGAIVSELVGLNSDDIPEDLLNEVGDTVTGNDQTGDRLEEATDYFWQEYPY